MPEVALEERDPAHHLDRARVLAGTCRCPRGAQLFGYTLFITVFSRWR